MDFSTIISYIVGAALIAGFAYVIVKKRKDADANKGTGSGVSNPEPPRDPERIPGDWLEK